MSAMQINLPCVTLPWLTAHAIAHGLTAYHVGTWTPYNDRVGIWIGVHCWRTVDEERADPAWIADKPVVQRILAVAKIESIHKLGEVTDSRAKIARTFCGREQFKATPDDYSVWEPGRALWRFKDVTLLPKPIYAPGKAPEKPSSWNWAMNKKTLGADLFDALRT